jgi:hypothetical protein
LWQHEFLGAPIVLAILNGMEKVTAGGIVCFSSSQGLIVLKVEPLLIGTLHCFVLPRMSPNIKPWKRLQIKNITDWKMHSLRVCTPRELASQGWRLYLNFGDSNSGHSFF